MTHYHQTESKVFHTLLYLGGFLLFWEWLRPLAIISDTGNVEVFVVFAGFCFLLSYLNLTRWIAIPLKLVAIVIILDGLFLQETIATHVWFQRFATQIDYNIGLIQNQIWTDFTPFFRTMLFLFILWLMTYLLYYWFVVVKRVFPFVLFTFIYITILDTFTAYQANTAIVRTFIISLFVLAIASFLNQMNRELIRPIFGKWFASSLMPIFVLLPILIVFGFLAPKFEPIWPDPVPYITSTAEDAGFKEGGNHAIQKAGYGEDDTQLGGSFIQDDTPIFIVDSKQRHYFRIESKDRYTGKGWERSTNLDFQLRPNGSFNLEMFSPEVKTKRLDASITFTDQVNFTKLVYPYGTNEIMGPDQIDYLFDRETGTIEIEGNDYSALFNDYNVQYDYPAFALNQLRQEKPNDPMDIQSNYLQLPNSLPNRVIELAKEITKDATNRYDKTKAIEGYFDKGDFTYQTKDVAIPEAEEDYVDQFLFDTQVGYCDNFSTSMVVMLRALDIPARWTKGFTGGQLTDQAQTFGNEKNTYEVTNGNAHSWVEVYFPNVGWVPFEPTIGFSGSADFYEEANGEATDTETEEDTMTEEQQQENQQQEEAKKQEETNDNIAENDDSAHAFGWYAWIIIVLIMIVGVTLYLYRYRWLNRLMMYRYASFASVEVFEHAYHYLLRVLNYKGMKQKPGETLREYAVRVDQHLGIDKMQQLTTMYERILYRNEVSIDQDEHAHELWEDMLKRIFS
ncbi:Protein-glutamine gamma-glutamyltransferase [Paraliobacillus sp. PM-2]|uniref:transglutaminase TgpA family protein n=1 Tax=Paraliobacillus sp. PM-2 TaxID=1462524 RepID=UPI00061C435F|nr:transglutaminaseTgpA domain-containing protein [Paraliobacillus sp. PM-2]CQR47391.1 Protein-glutamine gamma-glutamyltransferase [Paraliobacillus sp. PM-2]